MANTGVYDAVGSHYSKAAQGVGYKYADSIAKSFGYSREELNSVPEGSNLGLSCGNPFAIASIREGETVIDLGSGAGFDVFQAAKKVGESGRVIGVDMNKDMLARANKIKEDSKSANVEFVESRITDMSAIGSGVADCIISNCVVNLVPEDEKALVFKEMFRLLKPGGRVALSDILAKKPLPEKIRNDIAMYVGCIAGASMKDQYEAYLSEAGFKGKFSTDFEFTDDKADLNVYLQTNEDGTQKEFCCVPASDLDPNKVTQGTGCCGSKGVDKSPGPKNIEAQDGIQGVDLNEFVGSFKIYAVKV